MMQWQLLSNFQKLKEKTEILICRANNFDESKLVFIHGRMEDVKLPVDKV